MNTSKVIEKKLRGGGGADSAPPGMNRVNIHAPIKSYQIPYMNKTLPKAFTNNCNQTINS